MLSCLHGNALRRSCAAAARPRANRYSTQLSCLSLQSECFSIPGGVTYLNAAYMTPNMKSVEKAMIAGSCRKGEPWNITKDDFRIGREALRAAFASLINCSADSVALVPSASYGVAVAAANLPLVKGGNAVTLGMEHTSNRFAWQQSAAEAGAELRVAPAPGSLPRGVLWSDAVLDMIDQKTQVVAVAGNCWMDGSTLNLFDIQARCADVGAAFVLDGTQNVGACPVDMQKLQPDFFIVSGYKWMLCPYGISFLFAHPKWHVTGRTIEQHGWGDMDTGRGRAMWGLPGGETCEGQLDLGAPLDARRFEMGAPANFVTIPGALAAVQQLLEWSPERIAITLAPLTDAIAAAARERNWRVPTHHAQHMIGIRPAHGAEWPDDLVPRLWERHRVHISLRGGFLRVSPHLYNDLNDISKLFLALDSELTD